MLQILAIIAVVGMILSISALVIALGDDSDSDQIMDQDKDGIPDTQDVYINGNARLIVSIDSFHPGWSDSNDVGGFFPDPYFVIGIDYNNDSIIDDFKMSQIFSNTNTLASNPALVSPFYASFDIPDNATSVTIYIDAYEFNLGGVVHYDITNDTTTIGIVQTITAPFVGIWYDGLGAGFSPSGPIRYSVEVTG